MAKVDLARRAQIGQERRARTRAQLLSAATALISRQAVESITIDDIVKEAGVAKGTFYVHFEDTQALVVAVADGLIETFDELLQPQREALTDPILRIAFGCASFIEKAIENPSWAAVVGRMASSYPLIGRIARDRLREDLRQFCAESPPAERPDPAIALEMAVGGVLQTLGALASGRLEAEQARAVIAPILRAIDVKPARIRATLAQVAKLTAAQRKGADSPAAPPDARSASRAKR
jgi:AcrR family transcriptional regulator